MYGSPVRYDSSIDAVPLDDRRRPPGRFRAGRPPARRRPRPRRARRPRSPRSCLRCATDGIRRASACRTDEARRDRECFERLPARQHQHDERPGEVLAEQHRRDDGDAGEQVGAETPANQTDRELHDEHAAPDGQHEIERDVGLDRPHVRDKAQDEMDRDADQREGRDGGLARDVEGRARVDTSVKGKSNLRASRGFHESGAPKRHAEVCALPVRGHVHNGTDVVGSRRVQFQAGACTRVVAYDDGPGARRAVHQCVDDQRVAQRPPGRTPGRPRPHERAVARRTQGRALTFQSPCLSASVTARGSSTACSVSDSIREDHMMKIADVEAERPRVPHAPHESATMKALVYHGPGKRAWEERPRPALQSRDRRDRPDHDHDDLRHRPAHPQGRRADGDRRPHPRA